VEETSEPLSSTGRRLCGKTVVSKELSTADPSSEKDMVAEEHGQVEGRGKRGDEGVGLSFCRLRRFRKVNPF
jgi:hypothetical protein